MTLEDLEQRVRAASSLAALAKTIQVECDRADFDFKDLRLEVDGEGWDIELRITKRPT